MCILDKCSLAWIINFIVQNKDKKVERDNNEKKKNNYKVIMQKIEKNKIK